MLVPDDYSFKNEMIQYLSSHARNTEQHRSQPKVLMRVQAGAQEVIKAVDPNSVSFLDRSKLKFNRGPLALNNVLGLILKLYNPEDVDPAIAKAFFSALGKEMTSRQAELETVAPSYISFVEHHGSFCESTSSVSATYPLTPQAQEMEESMKGPLASEAKQLSIIDFAHSNPSLGFGFVMDGTGHGHSEVHPYLKLAINEFTRSYESNLRDRLPFKSQQEAQAFVDDQVSRFKAGLKKAQEQFSDNYPDTESPVSLEQCVDCTLALAQTILIEGEHYVMVATMGDSQIFLYDTAKNQFTEKTQLERNSVLLGSEVDIQFWKVDANKEVIGVTDGIIDFLTTEELREMRIKTGVMPAQELLAAMKGKIQSKGVHFDNKRREAYKDLTLEGESKLFLDASLYPKNIQHWHPALQESIKRYQKDKNIDVLFDLITDEMQFFLNNFPVQFVSHFKCALKELNRWLEEEDIPQPLLKTLQDELERATTPGELSVRLRTHLKEETLKLLKNHANAFVFLFLSFASPQIPEQANLIHSVNQYTENVVRGLQNRKIKIPDGIALYAPIETQIQEIKEEKEKETARSELNTRRHNIKTIASRSFREGLNQAELALHMGASREVDNIKHWDKNNTSYHDDIALFILRGF